MVFFYSNVEVSSYQSSIRVLWYSCNTIANRFAENLLDHPLPIIYLSVYANIRKAKECKGNEGKPIFCSGLLVFICYSVKTEEEPHQYFTQGSTSLGALLVQLVQRCAKKIMVILFFAFL